MNWVSSLDIRTINRLAAEIASLNAEQKQYAETWANRKKAFDEIVSNLEVLKDMIQYVYLILLQHSRHLPPTLADCRNSKGVRGRNKREDRPWETKTPKPKPKNRNKRKNRATTPPKPLPQPKPTRTTGRIRKSRRPGRRPHPRLWIPTPRLSNLPLPPLHRRRHRRNQRRHRNPKNHHGSAGTTKMAKVRWMAKVNLILEGMAGWMRTRSWQ